MEKLYNLWGPWAPWPPVSMPMLPGIPGLVGFYYHIVRKFDGGKFGKFTFFKHLATKNLVDQSKGLRVNVGTSRDDNLLEIASIYHNCFVGHFYRH